MFGGFTLLSAAVTGMAVVMYANADPGASLVNVVAFGSFTAAAAWLTARLYRPLRTTSSTSRVSPAAAAGFPSSRWPMRP